MSAPSRDDGTRVPDPSPPPKPSVNGKPATKMMCLHCEAEPAKPLVAMGIFGYAVCYCSVHCAASAAIWDFCLRNNPKCSFCDGPLDGFHICSKCDIAFTLADDLNYLPDELEHVNGKEVGG